MEKGQEGAGASGSSATGTVTVFRDRGIGRRLFDAGYWAIRVMTLWLVVTMVLAATTGSLHDVTMAAAAEWADWVIVAVGAIVLAVRLVRSQVCVTATTVVVVNPLSTRRIRCEDVLGVSVAPRKDRTPWPVEGRSLELDVRRPDGRPQEVLCWAAGARQMQALSEALGLPDPMPAERGNRSRTLKGLLAHRPLGAHRRQDLGAQGELR